MVWVERDSNKKQKREKDREAQKEKERERGWVKRDRQTKGC